MPPATETATPSGSIPSLLHAMRKLRPIRHHEPLAIPHRRPLLSVAIVEDLPNVYQLMSDSPNEIRPLERGIDPNRARLVRMYEPTQFGAFRILEKLQRNAREPEVVAGCLQRPLGEIR